MKKISTFALFMLLAVPAVATTPSRDETAIRNVLISFADIWNRQDLDAFGKLFSADADFVVITGKHLRGRAEIQKYHAELMKSAYAASQLVWKPVDVRFLRRDVAVAHVSTEISFNQGKEKRSSFATLVLSRHGRRWLIEALQNTLLSPPPAPKPASNQ